MSDSLNLVAQRESKIVGIALAFVSIVSILVMWFHPSVSSVDIHRQIQEVNEEAGLNKIVHSIMIAFVMLICICLTAYAKLRGFNRSVVLFGIIIYWLATIMMILAALMSGIVGPELAAHYLQANQNQAEVYQGISLLKFEMNQAFANFAVYCWCATMALFSLDMIAKQNLMRALGMIGLFAALSIGISLLIGWVSLGVSGMTLILVIVSCWQLCIAYLLLFKPYLVVKETT